MSAFSCCHSRNIKSSVDTQFLYTILYAHHQAISHFLLMILIPQPIPQYLSYSFTLSTNYLIEISFLSRSTAAAKFPILNGQSNELKREEQRPLLPDGDRLWATVLHAPALRSKSAQQGPRDVRRLQQTMPCGTFRRFLMRK